MHSISSSRLVHAPHHILLGARSSQAILHQGPSRRSQATVSSLRKIPCHSCSLPAHLLRPHPSSRPTLSSSCFPPARTPLSLPLARGVQTQAQTRPLDFGERDDIHPLVPQPSSARPLPDREIFGDPNDRALPLASRAPPAPASQPAPRPVPASPHQPALQPVSSAPNTAPKPFASTSRVSRPTKQVITLTPKAIQHLARLLDGPEPKMIRVGVKNKGCAGMAYHLEYVDQPGKFDEVVVAQSESGREVQVMIDSRALFSIIGSEMDWEESKLGNKFVFNNPNIKEQCGCGESFLV